MHSCSQHKCKHTKVEYCQSCNKVYCMNCKEVWESPLDYGLLYCSTYSYPINLVEGTTGDPLPITPTITCNHN